MTTLEELTSDQKLFAGFEYQMCTRLLTVFNHFNFPDPAAVITRTNA